MLVGLVVWLLILCELFLLVLECWFDCLLLGVFGIGLGSLFWTFVPGGLLLVWLTLIVICLRMCFFAPRVCYRRVFVVCFGCVWLLIVLIVWFIFVGNDLVIYCYLVIVFMCFWVGCCVDLLLVACS